MRRLFKKLQYTHPSKRHFIIIATCFWLSGIALWTIRGLHDNRRKEGTSVLLQEEIVALESAVEDAFNRVTHKEIEAWHLDDEVQPNLFPAANSIWKTYPEQELVSWHEIPVHSVRAMVENNKTYLGEMGVPVQVPTELKAKAKEKYSIHQLNVVASELISLNRRLPDIRHER